MSTASPEQARYTYSCVTCGDETDAFQGTARLSEELCRRCYGKREDRRPRELNDLSGKEWAQSSRSVQEFPDRRSPKQKRHGAAFPMSLAKQLISVYTSSGQMVLDPFLGVGTTLDACVELGRRGIGTEINPEYHELARQDLPNDGSQQAILANALELSEHVAPESVDFVLTSPPYGNLLNKVKGAFAYKWREHSSINAISNPAPYSSNPKDLGNLTYTEYLDAITEVMRQTFTALRPGGYAVWVVKDFRALKDKIPLVPLHMDVAEAAKVAGFTLWDIQIYDQTRFRPLVCLGYPSKNYYLNIGHSYNMVFRKW